MTFETPLDTVVIERRSSLQYLHEVLRRQGDGGLVMPLEPGHDPPLLAFRVIERVTTAGGGGWFAERVAPIHDPRPAQISITSGTTGTPKPILLSHRALADVTSRLIDAMGLDETVREYLGVPVTHSFGFGRVRAIAAVGGRSFLPERGFRVDELATMLGRGEVNALSAVPTLLRLVIEQRHRFAEAGAALRWLEIGSQAMTRAEKEAVHALFPNARIVQHYGLTEASRSTFLDISASEGAVLDSVGRATGNVEMRITDDGLIAIRGPHVADGIVTAGGVQPLVDADGWLVTRDLGRLEDGFLHFEGRADDLVNVAGIKVPSELFEERISARLPAPLRFAVAPGRDAVRGEILLVAHEPLASDADEAALRQAAAAVAEQLGVAQGFRLLPIAAIPVTDTGKVRRAAITALDVPPLAAPPPPTASSGADDRGTRVTAMFVDVFGEAARAPQASFHSLGGDSLNYIMVLKGLEEVLEAVPAEWDRMAIADLVPPTVSADGGVVDTFVAAFGEAGRDPHASFHSLGGDSLQYVLVLSRLEEALPAVPDEWDRTTVGELEALANPSANPTEAVIASFVANFGEVAGDEGASFQSLGGDSLNYVMVLSQLEEALGTVPDDWDTMSIGALGMLAGGRSQAVPATPVSRRPRLPNNLDTLRGLACTLVVALHVIGTNPDEGLRVWSGSAWHKWMDVLDLIRMPLFTAIAGFLYAAMPATRDGFAPFMARKCRQLLIPLLFATVLFWTLRQSVYGVIDRRLFWALVFGYRHLWYLDALLLIFAFVSLIDIRFRPNWRGWAMVIGVIALTSWAYPRIPVMHFNSAVGLLPFFVLGILLYQRPALLRSGWLLTASALAVVAIIGILQWFGPDALALGTFHYARWACGMGAVVVLLRLFPKTIWLERIAPYSFTIFLWHPLGMAATRNLLWALGMKEVWMLFVAGLLAGLTVPIAIHIAVRRFDWLRLPIIGR